MRGIAAALCGFGRIDIFYLEPDFQMAHKIWTGGQWTFAIDQLGGAFSTVPAAVASRAKRPPPHLPPRPEPSPRGEGEASTDIVLLPCKIDVFAVDKDFAMRQLTLWNGEASSPPQWANLGGLFTSSPGAIAWAGGRIDLFGLGLDLAMYRKVWDGLGWTPAWERLGGTFSSAASIASMQADRIDVFARGGDYTLRHRAFGPNGPLNDWQNLGGVLASPPVAVSWGANRLDVFAAGPDAALWHRWWDGEIWNDWESLGGSLSSDPSVVTQGPGLLDVFAAGADGIVNHFHFANETWSGPETIGTDAMTSAPTAVSIAPATFNVVAPGVDDNNLRHAEFDGTTWITSFAGLLGDHVGLPTRYRFSVDFVQANTARSLNTDTDTAQATIAPGKWPTQTKVQNVDSIGGTSPSQWQTNLLTFAPITVEMCETATFNYLIINNGHADQVTLDTAITQVGQALASKVIEFATGSSLLGAAGGFLLGALGSFLFQDCDGLVAAEQNQFHGRDLRLKTETGALNSVTTDHPGTDSPTGCGANSDYEVTWSVKRA
ncbi:MAG: hypothetical protein ABI906_10730 [Pseudomonadota bacterium]